jgi:hypothetical protein
MRKRKPMPRVVVHRVVAKRRRLFGDDDPLFDERELEFSACGDDEMKPGDS